jgi:hypothetical protein
MKRSMAAALGLTLAIASAAWRNGPTRTSSSRSCAASTGFPMSPATISAPPAARRPRPLRLVYNALWEEQVRTYELFPAARRHRRSEHRRAGRPGPATNVSNITIGDLGDVTGPGACAAASACFGRQRPAIDGVVAGERRFRSARDGCACPTTTSGGRSRPAATALGLFSLPLPDGPFPRTCALPRNCLGPRQRWGSGESPGASLDPPSGGAIRSCWRPGR